MSNINPNLLYEIADSKIKLMAYINDSLLDTHFSDDKIAVYAAAIMQAISTQVIAEMLTETTDELTRLNNIIHAQMEATGHGQP